MLFFQLCIPHRVSFLSHTLSTYTALYNTTAVPRCKAAMKKNVRAAQSHAEEGVLCL
jgi:hypothetical protein